MSETVRVEIENGVAWVTLNRPDRMNALTTEMLAALPTHLGKVAKDPEVRCVVLTGEGERAFSAGADLAPPGTQGNPVSPADRTLEASIDQLKHFQESSWLLHTMPKPTLAAINGAAAGASFSMALACDFRVVAEHAVMTTAFARIGFSGDFGGAYFMTQILGTAKAREFYMLGSRVDAEEAHNIGLVHRKFSSDSFRKETREFAEKIAAGPPLGYRYMKRNLNLAIHSHLRDLLDLEAEAMMRTGRSEDFMNATAAFLKKESPVFRGR